MADANALKALTEEDKAELMPLGIELLQPVFQEPILAKCAIKSAVYPDVMYMLLDEIIKAVIEDADAAAAGDAQ